MEWASHLDREWFEAYPDETEYTRTFIPGEAPIASARPGYELAVTVRWLADGIRMRSYAEMFILRENGVAR